MGCGFFDTVVIASKAKQSACREEVLRCHRTPLQMLPEEPQIEPAANCLGWAG